jgi:hypothetical protein
MTTPDPQPIPDAVAGGLHLGTVSPIPAFLADFICVSFGAARTTVYIPLISQRALDLGRIG